MAFVATRAGQVYYEESGSGLPVVMLHSTLHDHLDFEGVASRLSTRFRAIALDWPGHGRSETPAVPVDSMLLADVLTDVVWELALPPAVFIGNSVGGYAAARLAMAEPDRVVALVLVNTAGFANLTTLGRAFARLMGVPAVNRRVLPTLVPGYMKPRTEADRAITERVIARAKTAEGAKVAASLWHSFTTPEYDLRGRAGGINAPTLLVWGAQDTILPLKAGRQTQEAIPGSRLEVLDTGHVGFASAPEQFLAVVEPFIASAEPAHARVTGNNQSPTD